MDNNYNPLNDDENKNSIDENENLHTDETQSETSIETSETTQIAESELKPSKKPLLFIALGAIVIVAIVLAIIFSGGSDDGGENSSDSSDESKTSQSEQTTVPSDTTITTKKPETTVTSVETKAPETKVPETKAPETKAPETKAPETKAPETKAPETKAPEINIKNDAAKVKKEISSRGFYKFWETDLNAKLNYYSLSSEVEKTMLDNFAVSVKNLIKKLEQGNHDSAANHLFLYNNFVNYDAPFSYVDENGKAYVYFFESFSLNGQDLMLKHLRELENACIEKVPDFESRKSSYVNDYSQYYNYDFEYTSFWDVNSKTK